MAEKVLSNHADGRGSIVRKRRWAEAPTVHQGRLGIRSESIPIGLCTACGGVNIASGKHKALCIVLSSSDTVAAPNQMPRITIGILQDLKARGHTPQLEQVAPLGIEAHKDSTAS